MNEEQRAPAPTPAFVVADTAMLSVHQIEDMCRTTGMDVTLDGAPNFGGTAMVAGLGVGSDGKPKWCANCPHRNGCFEAPCLALPCLALHVTCLACYMHMYMHMDMQQSTVLYMSMAMAMVHGHGPWACRSSGGQKTLSLNS